MQIAYQPWGESLRELVRAGARAEAAGADALWAPELHRSATVAAAAIAAGTSRAQVGTGIALAFTRSPMITALEALDLDELSGGRFVLGLGSGVKRLNEDWHNARFGRAVPHLRETVRNVRAFWQAAAGGTGIDLPGDFEPMRLLGYQRGLHRQRDTIPVYLGGMGPAMTRLAGEIADGWISHELCSPGWVAAASAPDLARGRQRSGRPPEQLRVVASVLCSVADDPEVAVRHAAGTVGFYASVRTYADFWAHHGFSTEHERVAAELRSGRDADELGTDLPPEMVQAVTASGTAAQVAAWIGRYAGHVDCVKLSAPTHGLAPEVIRECQDRVIDLIAGLRIELTGPGTTAPVAAPDRGVPRSP